MGRRREKVKKNICGKIVLASALVAAGIGSARANADTDTVAAKLDGVSPGDTVDLSYINPGGGLGGASFRNLDVYAGALDWTAVAGSATGDSSTVLGLTSSDQSFSTYCVDIVHDIYINGTYGYTVATGSGTDALLQLTSVGHSTTTAAQIEDLWQADFKYTLYGYNNNANSAGTAWDSALGNISTNDASAAFQIDVWKILYGRTNLTVSTYGGSQLGENWLDNLSSDPSKTQYSFTSLIGTNLPSYGYGAGQDQAIAFPATTPQLGNAPPAVPLPPSLAGGLSIAAVAGLLKLRRRLFSV
jgi:hypothetical protein